MISLSKKLDSTSAISNRLKVFENSVNEIVPIHQSSKCFLSYSSTEAVICSCEESTLQIERRFFKVANIKSILNNLSIQRIVTCASIDRELTIVVLLNDNSLYIYENIPLEEADLTWPHSIQLTKHIHPIERRDWFWKEHQQHDSNNSE